MASIEITLDMSDEAMGIETWEGSDPETSLDNFREQVRRKVHAYYPDADVNVYEGNQSKIEIYDDDDEPIAKDGVRSAIDEVFNAQNWYVAIP